MNHLYEPFKPFLSITNHIGSPCVYVLRLGAILVTTHDSDWLVQDQPRSLAHASILRIEYWTIHSHHYTINNTINKHHLYMILYDDII